MSFSRQRFGSAALGSWGAVGLALAIGCSSKPSAPAEAAPAPSEEPRGDRKPAGASPNEEEPQASEELGNLWGTDITDSVGHLPKEEIQKVMRAAHPDFQKCYEAGLERDEKLTGRVTLDFVIEVDGSVTSVTSDEKKTTLPDDDVVTCVVASMQRLRFPGPTGGRIFVVYPLRFATESEE